MRIGRPVRLVGLGLVVGVLAGVASAVFLRSLAWATEQFALHGWLLLLLPAGGLLVGLAYHYGGGRAVEGNNLLLDEVHDPTDWVPRRMAPMVLVGTVVTHLFGGSAGREGTAIQMSGSLTDGLSRLLRLGPADRRALLVASLAGGFGSVFGVPFAGVVFAVEVQAVGRYDRSALLPSIAASFLGSWVTEALGVEHLATPDLGGTAIDPRVLLKVAVAGIAFGVLAALFTRSTHLVRSLLRRTVAWAPARPLVGGAVVVALTFLVGTRAYNGLSLQLITDSLSGDGAPTWAFALKLLFTAVTLGAGFVGGEVTPLFVMGATFGATAAGVLGAPPQLLAAVGMVAVFGAAANTPLACAVMGVELFGSGAAPYLILGCGVAWLCSPHEGIYRAQRVHRAKPGRAWTRRTADRRSDGELPSAG